MNVLSAHTPRLKTSVLSLVKPYGSSTEARRHYCRALLGAAITALFMLLLGVLFLSSAPALASANPGAAGLDDIDTTIVVGDSESTETGVELAQLDGLLYKIFRHPDGYAALLAGRLPIDTSLPATFEIAVPEGSRIIWFGEVSGGPRDDDRSFTEPHSVRTESGFDIYTATTNELRIQIEYLLDEDPFEALGAGNHLYRLSYTPLHDAESLLMAAYLPPGSSVQDPSFFQMESTVDDEIWAIQFNNVLGGESYDAVLYYGPPATIARQGAANLGEGLLTTLGIIAVTFIAAGAVFVITRRRRAQSDDNDSRDEDHEDN